MLSKEEFENKPISDKEWEEIRADAHKTGTKLKAIQKRLKKRVRLGVRVGIIELALIEKLAITLGITKSKLVRISLGHFGEYLDGLSQKEVAKLIIAIRKFD